MENYDLLMIGVLVAATLFGAWKGFVWQVASLGAIVASYFVALRFRDVVATHIQATPPWNTFVAMLVLYVGTSLGIWLAFRMVSQFIDKMKLKEFDRQFGALLGLAKGVLLCALITLFSVTLLGETQRQSIARSRSGQYIARLLQKSYPVLPPEAHQVLDPYIESLDRELRNGAAGYQVNLAPEGGGGSARHSRGAGTLFRGGEREVPLQVREEPRPDWAPPLDTATAPSAAEPYYASRARSAAASPAGPPSAPTVSGPAAASGHGNSGTAVPWPPSIPPAALRNPSESPTQSARR